MPLAAAIVGSRSHPVTHDIDARWTMAFAAALDDHAAAYMDTAAMTVLAHPLFPVCVEWPVILDIRRLPNFSGLSQGEAGRAVHASHDLEIFRPIRAGQRLTTRATVVGVERRAPGGFTMLQLDTTDAAGRLVCRTWQGSLYRGVEVEGSADWTAQPPEIAVPQPAPAQGLQIPLAVPRNLSHVYTECARIYNPIHTDRAVALAAGLPDIVLHGTATLGLAVSAIVRSRLGGDGTRIRRLGGRFRALVSLPTTLTLEVGPLENGTLAFRVETASGEAAIEQGFVVAG